MKAATLSRLLAYALAAVWLVNGLYCKVLHLVPRHEAIVARILGPTYAAPLTQLIGLAEMGMAVWVLSGRYIRLNAAVQIGLVAIMNVLEFFLAPDLLLWHRMNSVFAALFIVVIYIYGFGLTLGRKQLL
ncbi:DoxX-like family protein [Hymenobacter fodinae]|uniref:DoxX-like protein n=1 Tax=Hymenobacter fodinae TaxID=2510796 RepID=A0A4Z0P7S6_9BACT|nr:DoxX-like family protein [Hymenobacter fodinae]TGE08474.1 hypothetical protein EU556_12240 [Hymenobacter fodinae]